MRIFQGRASSGRYMDDDEESEVIARPKKTPSRRPQKHPDSDDEDEDERYGGQLANSLSYAGGASAARSRTSGGTRGRSQSIHRAGTGSTGSGARQMRSMTPETRKRLSSQRDSPEPSSPEVVDIVQADSSNISSPSRPQRSAAALRAASSSPEPAVQTRRGSARRNTMGGAASKASSRRSAGKAASYSQASEISSSEEDEEDIPPPRRRVSARRPSMSASSGGSRQRRGRSKSRSFTMDSEDEGDRRRGHVVPGSSLRRSRSRDAAIDTDSSSVEPPPVRRPSQNQRARSLSRSRQAPRRGSSRGRALAPSPSLQTRKKNQTKNSSKAQKPARHSWGGFLLGRGKKDKSKAKSKGQKKTKSQKKYMEDVRDDDDLVDVRDFSDEEDELDDRRETRSQNHHSRDLALRDEAPAPGGMQHSKPNVAKDEHYVDPKRRTPYANLYELDNFPAIDRVPTAIGYHSDDSREEFQGHRSRSRSRNPSARETAHTGGGDDVVDDDDDNMSFTSRYSVDVKSVRGSKLKKNKHGAGVSRFRNGAKDEDDDISHDENDDKYAQYLAGINNINPVLSDSSESCPPTWHPVLDAEDSDWYDEDDATKQKMDQQRNSHKKYQVSDVVSVSERKRQPTNKPRKRNKRDANKKGGENDGTRNIDIDNKDGPAGNDVDEPTGKGDAIVANRSDGSDVLGPKSSRAIVGRRPPAAKTGEEAFSEDEFEMTAAPGRQRRRKPQGRGRKSRQRDYEEDEEDTGIDEDDFSLSDASFDETTRRSRKQIQRKKMRSKGLSLRSPLGGKGKQSNTVKGLKDKFRNFRRGGRAAPTDYASSSDESSDLSDGMRLNPTQSMFSESRADDPALAQLEKDEFKESTATHNMLRNNRKEITELDEMDDASVKGDPNMMSCGVFPFALAGLTAKACFYGEPGQSQYNELNLDSVQIQRLRDSKYDSENKPKVEVILQDLQDPMAEKYEQLEKMERTRQRQSKQMKEAEQELENREREELLRMKREMRETEQRKLQQAQNKDLALQEAPDLNRGKNQSFVMDISDWVLNLDNNENTPRRKSSAKDKDTPRTNGRDGNASPTEKLPFSTIEVPTATMDSTESSKASTAGADGKHKGWRRSKKRAVSKNRQQDPLSAQDRNPAARPGPSKSNPKKKETKKKGWFRRG